MLMFRFALDGRREERHKKKMEYLQNQSWTKKARCNHSANQAEVFVINEEMVKRKKCIDKYNWKLSYDSFMREMTCNWNQ